MPFLTTLGVLIGAFCVARVVVLVLQLRRTGGSRRAVLVKAVAFAVGAAVVLFLLPPSGVTRALILGAFLLVAGGAAWVIHSLLFRNTAS
jgi:uncharacterized membrane protein HdeD (DUF308 family)